jgi:hypothetical protein
MADSGRSSVLVHILVIALCLTAFGFAIAAERRRSTVLIPRPFFFFIRASRNKQASVHPKLRMRWIARMRGDLGVDSSACTEGFLRFGLIQGFWGCPRLSGPTHPTVTVGIITRPASRSLDSCPHHVFGVLYSFGKTYIG